MRKFFLFFLCLLILSCNNKQSKVLPDSFNNSLIDSIKQELEFNDSIILLKKEHYNNTLQFAFIDFNKYSKFHNKLKKTYLSHYKNYFDSSLYNMILDNQLDSLYKNPNIPHNLINKWIPLYKYNEDYYLYLNCDFQMLYEVTDSTFIVYYMDGATPGLIWEYNHEKSSMNLIGKQNVVANLIMIDQVKQIYLISNSEHCGYYTPIDKLNEFYIIVQHCAEITQDNLIEFEKIKCN